ncbi:MscL family protein [Mycoplasma corogypsi]|uniref:MscL family protein n=1 Tax=Mycoplasma corogypsi TaxID=2106 RepID=UPI003872E638
MKRFKKSVKEAGGFFKKGNILLLAVGLLLGTIFNEVVKSLANDIIMNPIAIALGFKDIAQLQASGFLYGKFLAALLTFIIVSVVLFVILVTYFYAKSYHTDYLNSKKAPETPKPKTDELILEQLRLLNEKLEKLTPKDQKEEN